MKQKYILFLGISLFIGAVLTIVFSVYHASATSTINDALSMQIAPISPDFDKKTIESLKSRTQITPAFVALTTLESPIPTPTPQASPSAQILIPPITETPQQPQSTQSGGVLP